MGTRVVERIAVAGFAIGLLGLASATQNPYALAEKSDSLAESGSCATAGACAFHHDGHFATSGVQVADGLTVLIRMPR